jgi:hypothetical protein
VDSCSNIVRVSEKDSSDSTMIIYVWELAGIAAFYIVMLGVGI